MTCSCSYVERQEWQRRIAPIREHCRNHRGAAAAIVSAYREVVGRDVSRVTIEGWISGQHEPLAGAAFVLLSVAEAVVDKQKGLE